MGQVGTKFLQELRAGDAILIQHPTSLVEETRIVRMVLSDISAAISSAFSSDLVSSTAFHYIKAPPEDDDKQGDEEVGIRLLGRTDAGDIYTDRVDTVYTTDDQEAQAHGGRVDRLWHVCRWH